MSATLVPAPFGLPAPWRPWANRVSAASAATFGIPGFFKPRHPAGAFAGLSWYDTAPLKDLDETAYMQARLSKGTDGAVEGVFKYGPPKLTEGALDLGPWEQIFYGEFDGRRKKRVLVKVIGE